MNQATELDKARLEIAHLQDLLASHREREALMKSMEGLSLDECATRMVAAQAGAQTASLKAVELQNELDDLNRLFELQHTRTMEADELWRKAHPGNENVLPDLGRLVGWLVSERRRLIGVLRSLKTEQLDQEPEAWAIRCIEDHNAIIDEALKDV